jgi:hypothetical protein
LNRKLSKVATTIGPLILSTVAVLVLASSASAALEQVATFPGAGETWQVEGAESLAVNVTGAGGVPPGTFYTANRTRVESFSAAATFREEWGWALADGRPLFERCGPEGDPEFPVCRMGLLNGEQGEGLMQFRAAVAVAVDQKTGDVYVLDSGRKHGVVQIFSPNGSELIGSFGELAETFETIAESPTKFHAPPASGLAVNEAGDVYVSDFDISSGRIMEFEPQTPGDYEHYAYTGTANDIHRGGRLALADQSHLVVANEETISELDLGHPAEPVCAARIAGNGVAGVTVVEDGEVVYFNTKDKKLHQLACNTEGTYTEVAALTLSPKPESIVGLGWNPDLDWDSARRDGVLYAMDLSEERDSPLGHILAPAQAVPPLIASESASGVEAEGATLHASIDPRGSDTHYVFQYLSDAAYQINPPTERFAGATEAPIDGGTIAGSEALPVAAILPGLASETEYHYRVVATSHCNQADEAEVCETQGAEQSFRTLPSPQTGLPDSRAYELVSPAQKQGGEVFPAMPGTGSCGGGCKPGISSDRYPMQSSPGGESIVYQGFPFSETAGAAVYNEYLSKHTAAGWQTTSLAPALLGHPLQGYQAFDEELTEGVIYQTTPALSPEAPEGFPDLYTQPVAALGDLTPVSRTTPPNRASISGGFAMTYAGAAAGLSHLLFEANAALTTATASAPAAVDGGAHKQNLYESTPGGVRLVNVLPGNTTTVPGASFGSGTALSPGQDADYSHAISADGERIFWSAEDGQVYVREGGVSTREILDHAGRFLAASADGSKVLLSDGCLYVLAAEACEDLTLDAKALHEGGFQGIAGQSEDLSHVYFVDTAVLTEGSNDQGTVAQSGADNLYSWQNGATTFIATLLPADGLAPGGGANQGDWRASPAQRSSEASPSGTWLAFTSQAPLTGYDNSCAAGACREIFLYDSESGELRCSSCNPSGQSPLGESTLELNEGAAGALPQPRYLTDTGRLYFDSRDSLTSADTNSGSEDVYEYEPAGVGSCSRAGSCVFLISGGREHEDSDLLAVDTTGKNVFFTTRDRLVGADDDDLIDLYDARENGSAVEREVRSECSGEACQSSTPPLSELNEISSSFQGAGNLVAAIPVSKRPAARSLTRKQQLAKALKACRKKTSKSKRKTCEAQARKRFGPVQKAKKKRATVRAARHQIAGTQSRQHDYRGAE